MIYSLGLALAGLFVIIFTIWLLTAFPWIVYIFILLVAWDIAHYNIYNTSFLSNRIFT